MFESEASVFQQAGIQIGANAAASEESLLKEVLAPFGITRRNEALEMSRLYALLYCFENEVRDLVRETLEEKDGPDWWDKLPHKVKQHAETRRASALKDSWLEGQKRDPLGFVDFGMLAVVITEKWDCFSSIIPSQHWLRQRMDELEKARNSFGVGRVLSCPKVVPGAALFPGTTLG